MQNYLNVYFESSSGTTPQFAGFARSFKKFVEDEAEHAGFELISFNRGHFYISGFLLNKATGKYAYFSTDDVRGSRGWFDSVLVRTAEHDKDYRGGANGSCTLDDLVYTAGRLTN